MHALPDKKRAGGTGPLFLFEFLDPALSGLAGGPGEHHRKLLGHERLAQVVTGPALDGLDGGADTALGGHHHHPGGGGKTGAEEEVEAVAIRQVDIKKGEIQLG